jgi:hypothetical protein
VVKKKNWSPVVFEVELIDRVIDHKPHRSFEAKFCRFELGQKSFSKSHRFALLRAFLLLVDLQSVSCNQSRRGLHDTSHGLLRICFQVRLELLGERLQISRVCSSFLPLTESPSSCVPLIQFLPPRSSR